MVLRGCGMCDTELAYGYTAAMCICGELSAEHGLVCSQTRRPARGMLEALRSMLFCLEHIASAVDLGALEQVMAGGLSRTLSNVAMVGAKHYCKLRLADAQEELGRQQWQEVASLVRCSARRVRHAESWGLT
eukprot:2186425-Rhodomonas_salina.2